MRLLRRCSLVLLVGALGFAAASPAQAAAPDTTDALVALESEVAALVDLGAFPQPVPPKLADVAADWKDDLAGLDRDDLLGWLHDSDAEGAGHLDDLAAAPLSDAVRTALGPMADEDVRAVESGAMLRLPAKVYADALNDLEFRNGAPPARPEGGPMSTPRPNPTPPPVTASATGGPAWVWFAGGGLALVAALVSLFVVRGRRRSGGDGRRLPDSSVTELLDASRRFGATVDVAEIHRILLVETVAMTGAAAAVVVTVDAEGVATVADATDDLVVVPHHLDRGVVRRVLDTGAAIRTVGTDAAFGGEPRSMMVVPLVRGGVIAGVVVAVDDAARPFGPAQFDLLAQLVPIAAASLVAAGRHDDVAELSLTDGLTELGNRRRLDRDLVSALGVGAGTVGFVMVDIDHFKRFNDTHGHVAGDEVLRQVARVLRANVRDGDVVYRYGGEEFCVLLPDATPAEAAEVSERLRHAVESHEFAGGATQPGGRLTISVGTTVATRTDPTEVKERADHALYEAKHRGRNQVVVDGGDDVDRDAGA